MGSRRKKQLLPGCFPKLCLWEEKREQGEGEGEAGTVGGQAGDTEPGSRGSQLSSGSHSSLSSSPDCSQVLVTAHSSSHVALGVLGPPGGHSSWVHHGGMG